MTERRPASATFTDSTYTYDKVGNLTCVAAAGLKRVRTGLIGQAAYTYDDIYRLTRAKLPNAPAQTYGYDNAGNHQQLAVTGGAASAQLLRRERPADLRRRERCRSNL